jgi:hypothetical protein
MPLSDFYVGLSVVLTAISLIVSVVGWTITYKRRKEILERQIAGEIEKEKVSLSVSMTLAELEKARNWVNRGFRLLSLIKKIKTDTDKAELVGIEKEWEADASKIFHISYHLDKSSKTTYMRDKDDCLESFFAYFLFGVSTEFQRVVIGENLERADYKIDRGYDDALDRLDILTREVLGQPIINHQLTYKF